jgi:methionyl-tRNA synthetase
LNKELNNKDLLKNIQTSKEVSREELIKVFEILYDKGLINQSELQYAISTANKKYKSASQIEIKLKQCE